jgi:hypothetical protein
MLFYRAALPLSRRTLTYVAGIIRLVTLADKGYQGAVHAKIPYKGEEQA